MYEPVIKHTFDGVSVHFLCVFLSSKDTREMYGIIYQVRIGPFYSLGDSVTCSFESSGVLVC